MRLLYWGGGVPGIGSIVELVKREDADVLVLNNILNQAEIVPDQDRHFFAFAQSKFAHFYSTTPPDMRPGDMHRFIESVVLEKLDKETYRRYKALVDRQEEMSEAHYEKVSDLLEQLPDSVKPVIVPGRNDTCAIWDVFGEIPLHIDARTIDSIKLLGIGPLYEHSPALSKALRINASNFKGKYVRTQELFGLNADADVLIVNDFVSPCFDRRINTVSETNLLALEINEFVSGKWAQDGVTKDKHKVVITPARSNAFNSEVNHVFGSVVVNAGEHISRGCCAYIMDFDEKGIKEVVSLGIKGRRSFAFPLETVLAYPPITEQDLNVEIETHMKSLEEQIRDKDEIITALEKLNKQSDEEKQKLIKEFNDLSRQFSEYKDNKSVPVEAHKSLQRKSALLKDETIDLQSKLAAKAGEVKTSGEQLQKSIDEIKTMGVEAEEKDNKIKGLEEKLKNSAQSDEKLLAQNARLREGVATLFKQKKETEQEVKVFIENTEQLKKEYDVLLKTYEDLVKKFEALTSKSKFLEEQAKESGEKQSALNMQFADSLMKFAFNIFKKDRQTAIALYEMAYNALPDEQRKKDAAYSIAVLRGRDADEGKGDYNAVIEWFKKSEINDKQVAEDIRYCREKLNAS